MSERRGYSGPEEALAAIAAQTASAEPQAEKARAWSAEVEALVGIGVAEHGDVRAAVNVQGLLTGVSVSDTVASQGGRAVSRALQQAVRAAQVSVREQAEASSDRLWGPGSATSTAFRAEVEAATPLIEVQQMDSDGRSLPGNESAPKNDGGGTW